jgi:surfactin synthase thioesterase subunit
MFCLPYAGGGASAYVPWRRQPGPLDIQPVRLPGREGRGSEPPVRRMDVLVPPLADGLWPHLGCRFALFGHSMGALIAVELARQLSEAGRPPTCLIVSGRADPGSNQLRYTPQMPDAELIRFLLNLGGMPAQIAGNAEAMALFLPTIRADLELCATYRYSPEPGLSCPILVLYGQDEDRRADHRQQWRELSSDIRVRGFPGGHFFPFAESRAEVLACLQAELGY